MKEVCCCIEPSKKKGQEQGKPKTRRTSVGLVVKNVKLCKEKLLQVAFCGCVGVGLGSVSWIGWDVDVMVRDVFLWNWLCFSWVVACRAIESVSFLCLLEVAS